MHQTTTQTPQPGAQLDRVLGRVRDSLLIVVLLMLVAAMVLEVFGPEIRQFVEKQASTTTCDPRYDCGTIVND